MATSLTPHEQRVVQVSTRIADLERALAHAQAELRALLNQGAISATTGPAVAKFIGEVAEPKGSTAERIMEFFEKRGKDSKITTKSIIKETGLKSNNVRSALSALRKRGQLRQIRRGLWTAKLLIPEKKQEEGEQLNLASQTG